MSRAKKFKFLITSVRSITPYTCKIENQEKLKHYLEFHGLSEGWMLSERHDPETGELTHTLEKI